MTIHQNARTTPHGRALIVFRVLNEKGMTATGFLECAVAWLNTQGITAKQVMTDNVL